MRFFSSTASSFVIWKNSVRATEYFPQRFSRQIGKKLKGVEQEVLAAMKVYPWPGDVRELQNVMERAVILARHTITLHNLPDQMLHGTTQDTAESKERCTEIGGERADCQSAAETRGEQASGGNRVGGFPADASIQTERIWPAQWRLTWCKTLLYRCKYLHRNSGVTFNST